jgi:hypothetical protein
VHMRRGGKNLEPLVLFRCAGRFIVMHLGYKVRLPMVMVGVGGHQRLAEYSLEQLVLAA